MLPTANADRCRRAGSPPGGRVARSGAALALPARVAQPAHRSICAASNEVFHTDCWQAGQPQVSLMTPSNSVQHPPDAGSRRGCLLRRSPGAGGARPTIQPGAADRRLRGSNWWSARNLPNRPWRQASGQQVKPHRWPDGCTRISGFADGHRWRGREPSKNRRAWAGAQAPATPGSHLLGAGTWTGWPAMVRI